MKTVGIVVMVVVVLGGLTALGCGADGYTPQCTPPDYSDCLEPAKGGTLLDTDAGPDGTDEGG